MMRVLVQPEDFDVSAETERLLALCPEAGAVASFLGVVRSTTERPVEALTLEHYPAMTLAALERIAGEAVARFSLLGCSVIHRHGTLRARPRRRSGRRSILPAAAQLG
jgi:molybdopterin synthase catalytic subunit